ncbi:MAG: nucleotidyltransferase family protein, partial [Planctomycetes bacterium]|nr:nucleotidyltransferase family protein [Planctomycetota bacterium]
LAHRALNPVPGLREAAFVQQACTRAQLRVAAEVAGALASAGLRAVFVKGVAMALSVYPAAALRPFGDLDVLVDPQDRRRADQALRDMGFVTAPTDNPMEVDYHRSSPGGMDMCVDLHWDFTGRDGLQASVRVPVTDVIARARSAGGIPVPSFEDDLLLAAANLVRSAADRLILFVDFARLCAHPLDWPVTLERARAWGLKCSLWVGLDVARSLLAAPVPPFVLEELAPPPWRRRWIRRLTVPAELCRADREQEPRYRYLLKALCVDSCRELLDVVAAGPARLRRALG